MDNLMLLQKQFRGPVLIVLVIVDVIWVPMVVEVVKMGVEGIELFGGILIVLLGLNLFALNTRKQSDSLKLLPPDVLKEVNEQCMTGLRFGNGILCENDCLVFVNMEVTVIMLKDVTGLRLHGTRKGLIFVDVPWKKNGITNGGMFNQDTINGAHRSVKGKGTFREADKAVFWRELCSAWKKYTDAEPIEI